SALRSDLQELATAAGETALLTVSEEHIGASLCIDRVETSPPLRLSVDVGRLTPLHAGASAKVLLAYLRPDDIEQVLSRPLERLPPRAIATTQDLQAQISQLP